MIYNSTSIGVHLSPEQIGELAELKGIAAVKQGGTDIHVQVRTVALAGDKIAVLCGSDGTILGAMGVGMPGCTSTVANFMAAEYVALYGEIQAGSGRRPVTALSLATGPQLLPQARAACVDQGGA
jgi:4-hydroxy-tetrahydrodipicolinate synthase